ncbi:MAG TPA: D-alanyl-lipoteichoic acid biosynthesis protein DltB [Patescibacteria group bacterium]
MVPYTTFLYFGILAYIAVPTIIIGLIAKKKLSQTWLFAAMVIMLLIQYYVPEKFIGKNTIEIFWVVVAYGIFQWGIARALLFLHSSKKDNKLLSKGFYLALACAIAPLFIVKLMPVFDMSSPIAFVGISYVTFRVIDVVINIHDSLITELPFASFISFVLFFPTISSGPIDRYQRFHKDFSRERTRGEFVGDLNRAIHKIFIGFLYEFILASLIKTYWLDPSASMSGLSGLVSYMYAYSFYLFFDFAGYSAFAIGVSYLFGIHVPENFNWAFFSRNIKDFWNRWHMSLSFWFRDHVYSRFVFYAMKNKWLQNKFVISNIGYLITMGLMGFWHGFTWYYILYGFYHALLLIGYDYYSRTMKKRPSKMKLHPKLVHALSIFLTFNAVCFSFLIFSGRLDPSFKASQGPTGLTSTFSK